MGRRTRWWVVVVVGALVLSAAGCDTGAAPWTGTADTMVGALKTDPAGADTVAQALIDTIPTGTCRPAGQVDLGALAALGQWTQVCRFGRAGTSELGIDVQTGPLGPNLTYGSVLSEPEVCDRKVGEHWWVWHVAGQDPVHPCPSGYRYQPGG